MNAVRVVVEVFPIDRELPIGTAHFNGPFSRLTVFADTYDQALKGLMDVKNGIISLSDIPKTGLDLRTPCAKS